MRCSSRKVNAGRKWIKADFVVVTFDQDYRSDGLSNVMRKCQYWMKEGAR